VPKADILRRNNGCPIRPPHRVVRSPRLHERVEFSLAVDSCWGSSLKDFFIQHHFAVWLAVEHAEDVSYGRFSHPGRRFVYEVVSGTGRRDRLRE
jgi:hypothetical protein